MTIYDWPDDLLPNSMAFGLSSNTGVFESPLNKSVTTHRFPGERWIGELSFNSLDNDTSRDLDIIRAFLLKLGGKNGRFYMYDFTNAGSPAKGSPVVNGNGQYGGLLSTRGWLPNRVILRMGSYISINNELKLITKDIVSNATGFATLEFTPWLRVTPNDGDLIITDKPKGIFRLDDDMIMFNTVPGNTDITFPIVEVF